MLLKKSKIALLEKLCSGRLTYREIPCGAVRNKVSELKDFSEAGNRTTCYFHENCFRDWWLEPSDFLSLIESETRAPPFRIHANAARYDIKSKFSIECVLF